jgi:hypothetical protein
MRRIAPFLALTMLCAILYAQRPVEVKNQYKGTTVLPKSVSDTLWPGNALSATDFVLIADSNGGYVLGNNSYHDICKGQQYKVDSGYVIIGAVYWFGAKQVAPGSDDSIRFVVWRMDSLQGYTSMGYGYRSPGSELASVTVAMHEVDTASSLSGASAVTFPLPATILDDYVIGFDMSRMHTDTVGLVSTTNGAGGGAELVWEKWGINNTWHTLQASGWGFPALLDIDAMILPIIDLTEYGIQHAPLIHGVRCLAYPNPASDNFTAEISLETPSSSSRIEILDHTGRTFLLQDTGPMEKGINTIHFDTSSWPCGHYILIYYGYPGRYALSLVISR